MKKTSFVAVRSAAAVAGTWVRVTSDVAEETGTSGVSSCKRATERYATEFATIPGRMSATRQKHLFYIHRY